MTIRAGVLSLLRATVPAPVRQAARASWLRARAWRNASRRGPEPPPADVEFECRYCHSRSRHWQLGDVAATHPGPFERDDYQLLQCTRCEVVYLEPLPSAADLEVLYAKSVQFSDATYSDPVVAGRILDYYARRLQQLQLWPRPGTDCLEVGAGLAWISRAIRQRVPEARTWAQDLSGECAQHCPWVDRYIVAELADLVDLPDLQFVSLTHVIEHVPDPGQLLADLAGRMQPGAKMFVTGPYRPPLWRVRQGISPWRDYSYLHVPAHLSYLSEKWMRLAAARAGLELVHWEQDHDGHQAFEAVLRRLGPRTPVEQLAASI